MADNSFKKSIFDNQSSSSLEDESIDNGNTQDPTSSFSQKMKDTFLSSNQYSTNSNSLVNLVSALGIWVFVMLLAVSFVSFIYTGEVDQSLVLGFFSDTPTEDIPQNWLGMFGAVLSHFLIERWFGISAFLLLVIGATFGLVLVGKYTFNKWKELSISLFFVIFVMSAILGYLVYMTETQTAWAFLCGGIGYAISALFGQIFTPIFIIVALISFGYFFGKDRLNIELYTNFSDKKDSTKKTEKQKTTPQNPVPSANIDSFKEIEASKEKNQIESSVQENETESNQTQTSPSVSIVDDKKEQKDTNQQKKQNFFEKLFGDNSDTKQTESKKEENIQEKTEQNPFESNTKIKDNFNRKLPSKELKNEQLGKEIEKEEVQNNDLKSEIERAKEEAANKSKQNKKDGKKEEQKQDKDGFFIPSARDFGIDETNNEENKEKQEEENPFAIHIPSTKIPKQEITEENKAENTIQNTEKKEQKTPIQNQINEEEEKQDELDLDLPMPPSVSRVKDLYGENVEELVEDENGKPLYAGITVYNPNDELPKYTSPPTDLLDNPVVKKHQIDKDELNETKLRIEQTLKNFKIDIKRIHAEVGPTVTLYEIVPAPGVKIAQIRNLGDDIALNLSALGIRIIAPMPGKGTIGIEVPNKDREIVPLRTLLEHESFKHSRKELPLVLGKDISNQIFIADLTKMPHLLIGGATGQGKSVGINVILTSLIYKKHPSELKFVMIDPKKVEFSLFSKLEKHYLAHLPNAEPIVTDSVDAVKTLEALCREMDSRYDLLKDGDCRNIKEYNHKFKTHQLLNEQHRYLPYIVLVIDELADLMIIAGKAAEKPIARLAQMARAIGIHLVVATQRPSVNVVTGIIKANFPARMAFRVTSKIDSRIILDTGGAEQLVGQGDMLLSNGSDILRLQCAFIDTPEVERICKHIQDQKGFSAAYPLPEETNFNVEDDEYLAGDELF
ncbi:DNA segregation ATPase, FtsK/SpoIIIE family [Bernardetia litoralis DSM 6794]|uniref:DNA segregation ATPase, FtsK/SpoIIIE family n=1 Tax=Bernardetia litoralis (strain ATCC 23117 / DSM 6794 / NBRC 15988 / NCIMB 1366 / Fx l1 / Sio-4) TaxID=880071 RepID=I4AK48_BERLS|nr:DNA translocase FtsK [Bernardetia litoralis]AFM04333.1 DNA segregation ATPase, FtsK/SpoIIIE family [Bernardetia litoralis DSM 6794]